MIAFAKLQELIGGRPITYAGQKVVNLVVLAGLRRPRDRDRRRRRAPVGPGSDHPRRSAFGVLFVLPIGGADMPVVISLLNAFTGVAASATGFVLHNNVLIVSGMLVGASGTLLTLMMARAMGPVSGQRALRRLRNAAGHRRVDRRRGRRRPADDARGRRR